MLQNFHVKIRKSSTALLFLALILVACGMKQTSTPTPFPWMTPSPSPLLPTPQPTRKPIVRLDISKVIFSPDGRMLAYSYYGNFTVTLWDIENDRDLRTFSHSEVVTDIAFSPDGKILASGTYDGTVTLWDLESGEKRLSLKSEGERYIQGMAFSPDGKTLASGSYREDGAYLTLWNMENGRVSRTLKDNGYDPIEGIVFSPDGRMVASGSPFGAKVWDMASGQELSTLTVDPVCGGKDACALMVGVTGVAFSPDGRTLMVVNQVENIIMLWSMDGSALKTLRVGLRTQAAYSPNGEYLASLETSDDGRTQSIYLYDARTLQLIRRSIEMETQVYSFAFSPDGRVLVTGGSHGTIQFWDVTP